MLPEVSLQGSFGFSAGVFGGGGILQRAMGLSSGVSVGIGAFAGVSGAGAFAGIFGADGVGFSPEAMMGAGTSNFFHPLMGGNFEAASIGSNNGMGMVPGMMPFPMQGMQNQQMLMMMMMLLQMMMQMMQQQMGMQGMGMPGMGMSGMPGFGMPGGFGSPMGMGMPGMGMPGIGMPGGYGSPVGMVPPPVSRGGYNPGGAGQVNPNATIPNFGPNPGKAQIGQMLEAAAKKYGIPLDILKAVAWQESGWRANASSFDGGHGKGVMQIDDRFHKFARGQEVWDPAKNIEYGARYLRQLYDKTGNWQEALRRYNGGSSYPPKIFAHAQNKPWTKYGG